MSGEIVGSVEMLRRLVAFDTTSRNSNLDLIKYIQSYLDDFAKAGADHLLVHCEPSSTIHLHRTLGHIRDLGKVAGVVLNPATPLSMIEYVLELCGVILIMTVNPGFGGQQFLPEMLPKIRALRRLCDDRGLDPVIEVDGGIGGENAWEVLDAGANAIVAGSHIFHASDYAQAIAAIRNPKSHQF